MWREFKGFLVKQNMLALALAVVVGAATNEVVKAIVDGFIMPVIGLATPGGGWRTWTIPIGDAVTAADGTVSQNALQPGLFLATLVNFLIVALLAWQITKWLIRPEPAAPTPAGPPTRPCPFCRQAVDTAATRCAFCTSELAPIAA